MKKIKFIIIVLSILIIVISGVIIYLKATNKNNEVTNEDYNYIAIVENDEGKYGLINENGVLIVPCEYDNIISNELGLQEYVAEKDDKYGVINNKNEIIIEFLYDHISNVVLNSNESVYIVEKDNECGIINSNKDILVDFGKYDDIFGYGFESDVFIVKKNKQYGSIDKDFNVIIPTIYSDCRYRKEFDGFEVEKDDKIGCIDRTGKTIIPIEYDTIRYDENAEVFLVEQVDINKNSIYGYFDKSGNNVIPTIYDKVEEFSTIGDIAVSKNGKNGILNKNGNVIFPVEYNLEYQEFHTSSNSKLICYGENLKYGVINSQGKKIIPTEYDSKIEFINDGLFIVCKNNKYGIINEKNEIVIPIEYDELVDLNERGVYLKKGDKYLIADANCDSTLYDTATLIDESNCYIVSNDGKKGYISIDREIVIPFEYDIILVDNNLLYARKGLTMDIFELNGEKIPIDIGMDETLVQYIKEIGVACVTKPVGESYRRINKYGLINKNGEQIVDYIYEDIKTFVKIQK